MSITKYDVDHGRAVQVPHKRCKACGQDFPRTAEYFKPRFKSAGRYRPQTSNGLSPLCHLCMVKAEATHKGGRFTSATPEVLTLHKSEPPTPITDSEAEQVLTKWLLSTPPKLE